jgi:DNA invertase Pin-like site-specific DNA recombinase
MAQADTQPLPILPNPAAEPSTPARTRRNPATIRSVVVYLRTAQAGTDGQRILQRQRTELQAEIDFQGYQVAAWIEDLHQSGATRDRPGLTQALTLLASGYLDALICTDINRLTRSAAVTRQLAAHMAAHGWDLITLETGAEPTSLTTTDTGTTHDPATPAALPQA